MTHPPEDATAFDTAVQILIDEGFEGLASAMTLLLNEAMRLERGQALEAEAYERTPRRIGYANGFKPKTLRSRLGELRLQVPQVRPLPGGDPVGFYPSALERGLRSERALCVAIAQMFLQGVSTRKVTKILEQMCGLEVTSSQVSRAAALLDEELEAWRTRPLGEVPYLILDARYEKVRHGGSVRDCAVLIAVGVTAGGHRSVLGVSVSLSEAEVHWREFLKSLQDRGLIGVRMITSDDHAGLGAALAARFTGVAWQRCQCHLQRNAVAYVPKVEMRRGVALDLRSIFNARDLDGAQVLLSSAVAKYAKSAPRLSAWIEEAIPEGLTVFHLPEPHRRRLRTTNVLERLNREIKRRTRVATLFPNEASLLRLVSAILCETSEEWEAGRKYLNMETQD